MSILLLLLLLLLQLLSLHASDARLLRNDTSAIQVDHQPSNSTIKQLENEKLKGERKSNYSLPNNDISKDFDNEQKAAVDELAKGGKRSEERVSWKVGDHNGQPQAAGSFNLQDYLPPKTHPPVHN